MRINNELDTIVSKGVDCDVHKSDSLYDALLEQNILSID